MVSNAISAISCALNNRGRLASTRAPNSALQTMIAISIERKNSGALIGAKSTLEVVGVRNPQVARHAEIPIGVVAAVRIAGRRSQTGGVGTIEEILHRHIDAVLAPRIEKYPPGDIHDGVVAIGLGAVPKAGGISAAEVIDRQCRTPRLIGGMVVETRFDEIHRDIRD